ncbi:MAG: (2Fe-2S)-binding protein [Chloroflexi bacterium]|nr:(2Fe-2S)-binding protein [Chloroflexota bacterium]
MAVVVRGQKKTEQRLVSLNLNIDGKTVMAPQGTTVLRAAINAGIYIPHLCDYPGLTPFAGCRMCMVEVEGMRGMETSCTVRIREGMVVRTNTEKLRETQQEVLEVLLSDHPDRCLNCPRHQRCPSGAPCIRDDVVTNRCIFCPKNAQCELQRVVDFVELRRQRFGWIRRVGQIDFSNPFIHLNLSYCILCARCTRVCDEVRGLQAISFAHKGPEASISIAFEKALKDSNCEFCGACAVVCPTGAIMKADSYTQTYPEWELPVFADNTTETTCNYCADGCGLHLNAKGDRIASAFPVTDNPVNNEQLCVKGHFAYGYIDHPERLTVPLVR